MNGNENIWIETAYESNENNKYNGEYNMQEW